MNVLVDTSIWSLALRRSSPQDDPNVRELRRLIEESHAQMIGPVRQEILSGVREPSHFDTLRLRLRAFSDLEIGIADYERAAEFFNLCRQKGIQGSNTDFLICAVAAGRGLEIFTTDQDFRRYQAHVPIELHVVREQPDL